MRCRPSSRPGTLQRLQSHAAGANRIASPRVKHACGLSNAHLICAMHAHVFIAELKKRLCRICAQAGVRAAIVNMSVKEKKNVLAEMGVSFTNLQDANKVLLESSDFSEDQNPQDGQGASNEAGQVDSSDEDNNGGGDEDA
mmetsp:Transcript_29032/g.66706  ORF Transcript_29032/g.66706 Transcript_29032/m.66706 type:complete len:141 (-) Transcript_29032:303-725(-)